MESAKCGVNANAVLRSWTLLAAFGGSYAPDDILSCHKESLLHASLCFQTYLNIIIINIIIDVKEVVITFYNSHC